MLSYPSTISLSSRTLNHLADRIRSHRSQRRCRRRRLDGGRQALLALAHLRNGDTYTRLGRRVRRRREHRMAIRAGSDSPARGGADALATVMDRIRRLAHVILDGTLIPIDRSPIRSRTTPGNTSATA